MSAAGTKLRKLARGGLSEGFAHWCPGCRETHSIITKNAPGKPAWTFDGNLEQPTFGPSVRIYTYETEDDDGNPVAPFERTLCHYFIKAGRIEFCGDSPHELAGKTVDLPAWPYAPGAYGGIEE